MHHHHVKIFCWWQQSRTHRINRLVLGEAHRCDAIDANSQDGDEQMDKGDPVCKKRPGEEENNNTIHQCQEDKAC